VGIGFAAYEVTKRLDELREANEKLHGELDRLADSSRMENAELALSNTTLENLIAKLEHRPENSIKQALEEAAVAAGHLTEKLDGSIGKFYELLKKNEVSGIMQLFAPDDKDLAEIVGGKTGLGGMRGEIYEILRQGGDPTAVLKQYQVEAAATLKQAEYNQAHPLTTKERARLGMDVAGVGGAITGALMPNEDYTGRIEKLQALVQQIGYISQSYGLEKQHAALTGRKDQLEAAERDKPKVDEDLKRFREQAQAFERRGDEAELSAIGKIYYARDQLLEQAKKLKGVEADVAAIRKAADEQAGAIYKKDWEKFEAYDQEQRDKRNRQMALMMGPSKEQLKEWEQWFAAQDQVDSINLQSRKEGLNREAGQAQKMVGLRGCNPRNVPNQNRPGEAVGGRGSGADLERDERGGPIEGCCAGKGGAGERYLRSATGGPD
jgi:predicted  nucleic acid-binding Zn-ribbon protein